MQRLRQDLTRDEGSVCVYVLCMYACLCMSLCMYMHLSACFVCADVYVHGLCLMCVTCAEVYSACKVCGEGNGYAMF